MTAASNRPVWFLLTRHWISLVGVALVTTAGISWLFLLPQRGHAENPYAGILVALLLPLIFFVGLALIPLGVYLRRRAIRQGLIEPDFDRKAALKRLAWFLGLTTMANIIIGTQFTYRAVGYMETEQFCGATCHVMSPELAAYQNSTHFRVECVECHVAPGAKGWVQSKAAGVRQLAETVLNTYPRPIASAMESNRLVPAKETCENCHWSQKFTGARLRVINQYGDDEANARTQTVLMMLVGGSKKGGIHGAHLSPDVHIRYAAADPARQTIPWVEYRNAGEVKTFVSSESSQDSIQALPKYDMQCVDCHNRPTHTFESAEEGMDRALALGEISASLPFIKKQGVELLKASYGSSREATETLPQAVASFYQQNYPDVYAKRGQEITQAGQAILSIYHRNVFPDLKVTWGTYPNNLGHMDSSGCFRCHDGSHTTSQGDAISQDCGACHDLLAVGDASPEILKTLGISEQISAMQKH